mmetsp:Transcript_83790/g.232215  ORF Transcript_83790/g.232215 Transcript_83790/m.232215 type:complete len:213 (+) Transcript_83790:331-969(+)
MSAQQQPADHLLGGGLGHHVCSGADPPRQTSSRKFWHLPHAPRIHNPSTLRPLVRRHARRRWLLSRGVAEPLEQWLAVGALRDAAMQEEVTCHVQRVEDKEPRGLDAPGDQSRKLCARLGALLRPQPEQQLRGLGRGPLQRGGPPPACMALHPNLARALLARPRARRRQQHHLRPGGHLALALLLQLTAARQAVADLSHLHDRLSPPAQQAA